MGLQIADLLKEKQIQLELSATDHAGALREIVTLFSGNPDVGNLDAFHAALMAREQLSCTAAGNGVAFPHARTDLVKKLVLAIGRSREGVLFPGNPDPVHLIFVLGTPRALISDYLVCVATLARFVRDAGTRQRLLTAESAEKIMASLT